MDIHSITGMAGELAKVAMVAGTFLLMGMVRQSMRRGPWVK